MPSSPVPETMVGFGSVAAKTSGRRFAKELVALQPDLIVTSSTPATAVMLKQTRTIPVIFVVVADPVGSGFVTNLARPGGNVTGRGPGDCCRRDQRGHSQPRGAGSLKASTRSI